MKKKGVILLIVFVLAIIGIGVFSQWKNRIIWNDENAIGNTSGNLLNGGLFCETDDKIYFSNPNDDGALYSMDLNLENFKKENDDKVASINATNNYIIYARRNHEKETVIGQFYVFNLVGLYRKNRNNNIIKPLYNKEIGVAALSGNYVYYQHYDKKKGLEFYQVKIDGNEEKRITEEPINPATIINNELYYTGVTSDGNIHVMDLATGISNVIYEGNAYSCIVSGDYIYFIDLEHNYGITRINLDGTNPVLLVKESCSFYNISNSGKYLYYQIDNQKNNRICRMNLETKKSKVLKKGDFSNIHVTSDYVFFQEFKTGTIYVLSSGDSTDIHVFEPSTSKEK